MPPKEIEININRRGVIKIAFILAFVLLFLSPFFSDLSSTAFASDIGIGQICLNPTYYYGLFCRCVGKDGSFLGWCEGLQWCCSEGCCPHWNQCCEYKGSYRCAGECCYYFDGKTLPKYHLCGEGEICCGPMCCPSRYTAISPDGGCAVCSAVSSDGTTETNYECYDPKIKKKYCDGAKIVYCELDEIYCAGACYPDYYGCMKCGGKGYPYNKLISKGCCYGVPEQFSKAHYFFTCNLGDSCCYNKCCPGEGNVYREAEENIVSLGNPRAGTLFICSSFIDEDKMSQHYGKLITTYCCQENTKFCGDGCCGPEDICSSCSYGGIHYYACLPPNKKLCCEIVNEEYKVYVCERFIADNIYSPGSWWYLPSFGACDRIIGATCYLNPCCAGNCLGEYDECCSMREGETWEEWGENPWKKVSCINGRCRLCSYYFENYLGSGESKSFFNYYCVNPETEFLCHPGEEIAIEKKKCEVCRKNDQFCVYDGCCDEAFMCPGTDVPVTWYDYRPSIRRCCDNNEKCEYCGTLVNFEGKSAKGYYCIGLNEKCCHDAGYDSYGKRKPSYLCDEDEHCCKGICCPADSPVCCGGRYCCKLGERCCGGQCCPPGQKCCSYTDSAGKTQYYCCDGECCHDKCCSAGQKCYDNWGYYDTPRRTICCQENEKGCYTSSNIGWWCCPPEKPVCCYYGLCCAEGVRCQLLGGAYRCTCKTGERTCSDLGLNNIYCCKGTDTCCYGVCCPTGTSCCMTGPDSWSCCPAKIQVQ